MVAGQEDDDVSFAAAANRDRTLAQEMMGNEFYRQKLDGYLAVLPTGKPEHFDKDATSAPDMSNPEHAEWVKRAQKILGALLWLSTRTRPDIACALSLAAQSLWHNLDHLKIRLRHLLQYLNTTRTFGLLYTFS